MLVDIELPYYHVVFFQQFYEMNLRPAGQYYTRNERRSSNHVN